MRIKILSHPIFYLDAPTEEGYLNCYTKFRILPANFNLSTLENFEKLTHSQTEWYKLFTTNVNNIKLFSLANETTSFKAQTCIKGFVMDST